MLTTLYFIMALVISASFAIQYRQDFEDDYSAYIASVCFLFLLWPLAVIAFLFCRD